MSSRTAHAVRNLVVTSVVAAISIDMPAVTASPSTLTGVPSVPGDFLAALMSAITGAPSAVSDGAPTATSATDALVVPVVAPLDVPAVATSIVMPTAPPAATVMTPKAVETLTPQAVETLTPVGDSTIACTTLQPSDAPVSAPVGVRPPTGRTWRERLVMGYVAPTPTPTPTSTVTTDPITTSLAGPAGPLTAAAAPTRAPSSVTSTTRRIPGLPTRGHTIVRTVTRIITTTITTTEAPPASVDRVGVSARADGTRDLLAADETVPERDTIDPSAPVPAVTGDHPTIASPGLPTTVLPPVVAPASSTSHPTAATPVAPTLNPTAVRTPQATTAPRIATDHVPAGLGMSGTDRVARVREQFGTRPVQRLAIELDDARVAVRFRGDKVSVDVISDPKGTLDESWARQVERTIDQAVRVQDPAPTGGRATPNGRDHGNPHGNDHGNDHGNSRDTPDRRGRDSRRDRGRSFESVWEKEELA